jgi:hypothetical protein
MTNVARLLNDAELDTVTGGGGLHTLGTTIVLPQIPRDKDLLTPQEIAKLFSVVGGFNPPIPRG